MSQSVRFQRTNIPGAVDDLVLLEKLTNQDISECLRKRLQAHQIYTYISNVLICVNPFYRFPIYTDEWIDAYRTLHMNDLAPHVFALSEQTYRAMVQEEEDQCIIISGESGAGKTEASKQVMAYIAAVSGNTKEMQRVKEIMLQSNPLLEAFGNAKTVRNDNSSRFGKFFEIYFDAAGGPIGGKISNFLLEKSRVIGQQKGERCFHIFYQLCAAAATGRFSELKLKPAAEYPYLNGGGTLTLDGVDDLAEFADTEKAMKAMGMSPGAISQLFSLLAAILHIGCITFRQKPGSGGSGAPAEFVVADSASLQQVAKLLEADPGLLERSLTWKVFDTGRGEMINIPLENQECEAQRDALAKVIYDKVFDFVVKVVNTAFGDTKYARMIGVLDIYGFEIFQNNSFEQFCINYVNEKLQQIFIELTLKVEQEEYVKEQIKWDPIKFFNNEVVCALIEGKRPPGVFSVIDDVCATMGKEDAKGVDSKMMDKLDQFCGSHQHFNRTERGFIVRHYAGNVEYNKKDFVMKNKDSLTVDLLDVVVSASNPLMEQLFAEERTDRELAMAGEKSTGPKGRKATLGVKIVGQAAKLVTTLKRCTPHYIRCVKPNDAKEALGFVMDRVNHQVTYLGLLENVRVRRAGFAYRQYFDKFVRRFRYLSPQTFPRMIPKTDKDACAAIMAAVPGMSAGTSYQFGTSKIFLRRPEDLFKLEELRSSSFDKMACSIQRAWKTFSTRSVLIKLRQNAVKFLEKSGKKRRCGSVLRLYQGDYVGYHNLDPNIKAIFEYVEPTVGEWFEYADPNTGNKYYWNPTLNQTSWTNPATTVPHKPVFHFMDHVQRLKWHSKGICGKELFAISDDALWFIETVVTTTVIKGKPGKPARGKQPAVAAIPDQTTTTVHYVLRKKIPLNNICKLTTSTFADDHLVIHTYGVPPLAAPPVTNIKGVTDCQGGCGNIFVRPNPKTQPKGAPKILPTKPFNCFRCGGVYCALCVPHEQPIPRFGYYSPVKMCARCFGKEPSEAVDDVVLVSEKKTEVLALLKARWRVIMGQTLECVFSDNFQYFNRTEAPIPKPKLKPKPKPVKKGQTPPPEEPDVPPQQEPVARQIFFQADANPNLPFPMMYVSNPTCIMVTCGTGVDMNQVDAINRSKAQRAEEARLRYVAEQEELKKREQDKEAAREAERKRMVEEKRKLREEEQAREAAEEAEREARRAEREARRQAVVAKATGQPVGDAAAGSKCKQCDCVSFKPHPMRPTQCIACFHQHE